MSKATNQSLLLLSIVYGSFKLLIDNEVKEKGREDISGTLYYACELANNIIRDFKATGDERKNFMWMEKQLVFWKLLINEAEVEWDSFILITVAQSILEDLLSIIRDKEKVDALQQLREVVNALSNSIESKSLAEESKHIDMITDFLKKLYTVIEFYP